MPVKLSDLRNNRRKFILKYKFGEDGEERPISIYYNPSKLNVKFEKRSQKLREKMMDLSKRRAGGERITEEILTETEVYIMFLDQVVIGWDVIGDDGKVTPLTKEVYEDLGSEFIGRTFAGLIEEMRPTQAPERSTSSSSDSDDS